MMPLAIAAVPLASDWFSARTLGEATLIAVGAFIAGYLVSWIWPRGHNPQVFGTLTAVAIVGGLAFMGSTGAGMALIILVALAALFAMAGILW